jgi:serine/threonine-protein kinase PpkA
MVHRGWSLAMVALLLVVDGLSSVACAQERPPVMLEVKKRPIMIEGKTFLPLRVLARPFSNIYKESDATKGTVEENVPTFQAYYVYTRPEVKATETDIKGWYEVGSDNQGTVLGWMRAEDVLEWKQNMSLAYTHPERRKPVLMFETREGLLDLVKAPSDRRKERAEELYHTIEAGKIPPDFPVRSVEPKQAIAIDKQFYLLPILEFGESGLDQYEIRVLKLAAAVAGGPDARDRTVLKDNLDYREQVVSRNPDPELLKKLEMDIVFVIDTTVSMQPWINATLEAIKNIALSITSDAAIRQSVHFGLWGYRDSLTIPGIEYLAKNFTPTLQPVEDFIRTLQGVHEATVDSVNFDEDMFSGMSDAMTKTAWSSDKSLRFLVLVGDAPSHSLGDAWNYSGHSAETLRQYADDHSIYIAALHPREPAPRLQKFHEQAEKQFRILATNKGTSKEVVYYTVNGRDVKAFAQEARNLADDLVQIIAEAKKGQVTATPAATSPGGAQPQAQICGGIAAISCPEGSSCEFPKTNRTDAQGICRKSTPPPTFKEAVRNMGRAALVEWIGREVGAKAPRDIIAWAVDKDLFDPALPSMEVRLLINKRELDELRKVLEDVMAAGRKGQIGGEDFFKVLQTTAATVARGEQSRIRQAKSMAELVPDFLQGLPYKSQLMALTKELWASWSTDEQEDFLKGVDSKIKLYAAMHDTPDRWIQLHPGDAPDEFVYPLALESLP